MLNNLWYPKQAPLQGLTGLWGGLSSNLTGGGDSSFWPIDGYFTFTSGGAGRSNEGQSQSTFRTWYNSNYTGSRSETDGDPGDYSNLDSDTVTTMMGSTDYYGCSGNGNQYVVIQDDGTYEIFIAGSSGTDSNGATAGQSYTCKFKGTVSLSADDVLFFAVGQMGQYGDNVYNSGGSGGTFVYKGTTGGGSHTLLAVAGGGGGTSDNTPGTTGQSPWQNAPLTSTDGQPGRDSNHTTAGVSGGSSGNRGNFAPFTYSAGPGGGWQTTSNVTAPNHACPQYPAAPQSGRGYDGPSTATTPPSSAFQGGHGYSDCQSYLRGGFGAGGGGSGACCSSGSGGGGGYSGGGVGNDCCSSTGGGGGLYQSGISVTSPAAVHDTGTSGGFFRLKRTA